MIYLYQISQINKDEKFLDEIQFICETVNARSCICEYILNRNIYDLRYNILNAAVQHKKSLEDI